MASLRSQVLEAYKSLHKTRKLVFEGDVYALQKARLRINEEYKKCKGIQESEAIEELIAHSRAVEKELKTTVIQARETEPGIYEMKLRKDFPKLDNVPYTDCKRT